MAKHGEFLLGPATGPSWKNSSGGTKTGRLQAGRQGGRPAPVLAITLPNQTRRQGDILDSWSAKWLIAECLSGGD